MTNGNFRLKPSLERACVDPISTFTPKRMRTKTALVPNPYVFQPNSSLKQMCRVWMRNK